MGGHGQTKDAIVGLNGLRKTMKTNLISIWNVEHISHLFEARISSLQQRNPLISLAVRSVYNCAQIITWKILML
jgi:hypothetical protein